MQLNSMLTTSQIDCADCALAGGSIVNDLQLYSEVRNSLELALFLLCFPPIFAVEPALLLSESAAQSMACTM